MDVKRELDKATSELATAAIIWSSQPERAIELVSSVIRSLGGAIRPLMDEAFSAFDAQLTKAQSETALARSSWRAAAESAAAAESRVEGLTAALERDSIQDGDDYLAAKRMVDRYANLHPDIREELDGRDSADDQ